MPPLCPPKTAFSFAFPGHSDGPPLPRWLSYQQIDRLFSYLTKRARTDDLRGVRNLAIVETLYSTGMRLSELVELELNDVDLAQRQLSVDANGRNQRMVPLGIFAATALGNYLSRAPVQPDGAVFLVRRDRQTKRISCKGVQDMMDLVYHTLFGSEHGLNVQSLRHTCATRMRDAGANLIVLAELLGHVSVWTTEVYDRCSIEHLKQQHRMAHPRA